MLEPSDEELRIIEKELIGDDYELGFLVKDDYVIIDGRRIELN